MTTCVSAGHPFRVMLAVAVARRSVFAPTEDDRYRDGWSQAVTRTPRGCAFLCGLHLEDT
jgi:hypothetical protein